jgi:putative selenate reductase molybdopterin-binding subunit
MELELRINGVVESLEIAPNETLLSMLRREGYYSVKQGCETGECGACTVLVDGVARPSCVMLAGQAGGCTLTTVEGIGSVRKLHPLQQAFIDVGAVQCGFCMPGMLLSAYALLKRNPHPTEDEVRDALSGNLCRCTGYVRAIQAVLRAAALLRGEKIEPVEYSTTNYQITGEQPVAGTATRKFPILTTGTAATLAGPRLEVVCEVVGQSVSKIDAVKLVTGKSTFVADIQPQGMLYGGVLSSPHAHAIIRHIDTSEAKALPGVHAVLTHKDVPRVAYTGVERTPGEEGPHDQYSLDYILRYVGDRVAVVAAETPELVEQALRLIRVEYDVQPAIIDPRQALDPSAPRLHPETESYGIFDTTRNIAARVGAELGDMEAGFAAADLVVEGEYYAPAIHPSPIEKQSVISYFDQDDCLVVQTSTQVPYHVRRTLARILNLPQRRIKIVRPSAGGDFGAKQGIMLEDLCALLTLATNRPVMLVQSRSAAFQSSYVRQQYIIRLKTGVKRDGTIIANQMVLLTGTGAHATHPLTTAGNVASEALSLYPCPNTRYVAEVLYTNLPPAAALHSYGTAQEFFALESHMDEVAKRLNIDALELRRRNWIKAGDTYRLLKVGYKGKEATPRVESCGLPDCLRLVEEKLNWHTKRGRVGNGRFRRGVGLALSLACDVQVGTGTGGAMIKLNEDGSFDVFAGDSADGAKTLLTQIAAEVLGVPLGGVVLHSSHLEMQPGSVSEGASSALYLSGGAVKRAAEQVRRQVLAVGGRMLNVLPESVKIQNGILTAPDGGTVSIEQVAKHSLYGENRHIMTTASWKMPQIPTTFAAQGVEIEVDMETGVIRVLKAVSVVDAGRAINPLQTEGQIQGSVVQGLGAGLSEEMVYDQKGNLLTTNLSDYRILGVSDIPELETYLVETVDPSGPFGAKAVAELPMVGLAPALANAVADAIGVRMRQIPLTPERLLRAIHAQAAAR